MEHVVKIISTKKITHDVKQFEVEKSKEFKFTPGQATDLTINQKAWKDKKNPFTFTSLNGDENLQFTIKIYAGSDEGVTRKLNKLKPGDELLISDAWGAIEYKGPGYFIAGGAGITPFVAILRQLHKDGEIAGNTLFFSNKTDKDIVLEDELKTMLGNNCLFTTTQQQGEGDHRKINKAFLEKEVADFKKHFYLCGPDKMVKHLTKVLKQLGAKADSVVFEK